MSLLKLSVVVLFISSHMHTVHSYGYSKWGFGACPKVTPMKDFDIRKLYGETMYLIAHYSETTFIDRHCTRTRYSDSNPGADICRVAVEQISVKYDDGNIENSEFYLLLPNETDHSIWINTVREYRISKVLSMFSKPHAAHKHPSYSPIARSTICGESLVFIKKSLELAAKYVTQRMHHLQGHWF